MKERTWLVQPLPRNNKLSNCISLFLYSDKTDFYISQSRSVSVSLFLPIRNKCGSVADVSASLAVPAYQGFLTLRCPWIFKLDICAVSFRKTLQTTKHKITCYITNY